MEYADLSPLCQKNHYLTFLSVNKTMQNPQAHFVCSRRMREWDRFFYVTTGKITFTTPGGTLSAEAGDIVYLPCDISYTSDWEKEDDIGYITIEFLLFSDGNEPFRASKEICMLCHDKGRVYLPAFENLCEVWRSGVLGYGLRSRSLFYDLLTRLSLESINRNLRHSHKSIYKAILYIENHYLEDIRADELAGMCGMCQSYFRRCFASYAGMPPVTYKNYLRIRKAAELLKTGEYTVREAAELVNICDTAYFNKLFKSFFGVNPKEFKA